MTMLPRVSLYREILNVHDRELDQNIAGSKSSDESIRKPSTRASAQTVPTDYSGDTAVPHSGKGLLDFPTSLDAPSAHGFKTHMKLSSLNDDLDGKSFDPDFRDIKFGFMSEQYDRGIMHSSKNVMIDPEELNSRIHVYLDNGNFAPPVDKAHHPDKNMNSIYSAHPYDDAALFDALNQPELRYIKENFSEVRNYYRMRSQNGSLA
jgi:hypothetical protein